MIPTPRVEVVIPNFNGERLLPDCLDSLDRQTFRSFSTIVVDNGSVDGSVSVARARPNVRVVRLAGNHGFSVAVNRGIADSQAPYLALLNNDARPSARWLSALVDTLDREPRAAAATSKILSLRNPGTIDNVGDGLGRRGVPYPIGHREVDVGQYAEPRWVFGACGGAALYRRSLFEEVGFFDERFFAYHEDVDLSFRAQLVGKGCIYVPDAVVLHVGSATTGSKINPFTVYHSTRNMLLLLGKNMPVSLGIRYFPSLVSGQLYWFLKMAVKEGEWGAWARGIIAGVARLPSVIADRGTIRRTVKRADLHRLLTSSEKEIGSSIERKRRHQRDESGRMSAGVRNPGKVESSPAAAALAPSRGIGSAS
ncbi:MAG: glycosyltransferase family 2 protein [Planctomycetes bacterium]|nr:glycosyltransferase family 2 protein [Planctomycetota bacterium]